MDSFFLYLSVCMLGMAAGMWIQRDIFLMDLSHELRRTLEELNQKREN